MALERFSLANQVAVVTGGSRGIGQALCLGLAEAGADVVVTSRTLAACAAVAAQVRALGRRALAVAADVAEEAQVQDLFARTQAELGRVDILVNNAGMSYFTPAMKMPLAEWNRVLAVNLTGPFLCARTAAGYMARQGGGAIINISSSTAHTGNPFIPAYTAAKAGLEGLTRQLAVEWLSRNIRVNCVVMGIVDTDLMRGIIQDQAARKRIIERTPMHRLGTPDEAVGMVLLLASGAGSFMTGAVVPVDGGWSAG